MTPRFRLSVVFVVFSCFSILYFLRIADHRAIPASSLKSSLPQEFRRPSHVATTAIDTDSRGLMTFVQGKYSRHPIELLIERAKLQAVQQDAMIRSVMTLDSAIHEYEKAFALRPPGGYERW